MSMHRGVIRPGRQWLWRKQQSRFAIVHGISCPKLGDRPCGFRKDKREHAPSCIHRHAGAKGNHGRSRALLTHGIPYVKRAPTFKIKGVDESVIDAVAQQYEKSNEKVDSLYGGERCGISGHVCSSCWIIPIETFRKYPL